MGVGVPQDTGLYCVGMQQQLALGLEGGGTKTEWVLISLPENKIVREGVLPAANLKLITDEVLGRMFSVLPVDVARAGDKGP